MPCSRATPLSPHREVFRHSYVYFLNAAGGQPQG